VELDTHPDLDKIQYSLQGPIAKMKYLSEFAADVYHMSMAELEYLTYTASIPID